MILGIDLGSARIALVGAHEVLPLQVIVAHTIKVNPELDGHRPVGRRKYESDAKSMADAVAEIVAGAKRNRERLTKVVIEHQKDFYAPPDRSPQAIAAMAFAHKICTILHDRIEQALRALGLEVVTIPRASWAHRVVPNHRGGIGDAEANEGVRAQCTPETWEMLDGQDECDAAGALIWALSEAPRKNRRYRYRDRRKDKSKPRFADLTPEQRRARRLAGARVQNWKRRGKARAEARAAARCQCPGKHRAACPLSALSRQVARAAQHGPFLR